MLNFQIGNIKIKSPIMNVTSNLTTNNWMLGENGSKLGAVWLAPTVDPVWAAWYAYYTEQGTYLYMYTLMPIYVVGIVGNSLSTVVVTRGSFRHMSSGVYLLLLSLADLGTCIAISIIWLDELYLNSAIGRIGWLCKLGSYVQNVFFVMSSWMIVAITAERAIIIALPHKSKAILTRKRAWRVSGCVLFVLCALNTYQPIIYGVEPGDSCFLTEDYNNNLSGVIFGVVDALQYALIPLVILLVCNIILVHNLCKSLHFHSAAGVAQSTDAGTRRIIPMVITISVVFMVLTFPGALFLLSDYIPRDILWMPPSRELWFEIVNMFRYLNHTINFFLYLLTGPKFRQEFWNLFKFRNT